MNRINDILYHLIENHHLYYWSKPNDINYPAVRLGDIYGENILFVFNDVNHTALIERLISREQDKTEYLSPLRYTAGIIELSYIGDLISKVRKWLNENPEFDLVMQYESMPRTKNYINEVFDF